MKNILTLLFICLTVCSAYSQKDTTKTQNLKSSVFANIYAGFYYGLNENSSPRSAFNMPTAILGYKREISEKVNAIILYDVTRTTNFGYTDSSGISGYFEGSKYTAFLKMAQIDWKIKKFLELSVGQMLNEQYLTVQDKWWDHRYVDVTFQEKFKFGMPADFGARLKYTYKDKIRFSLTAVNGEGPFKYQDADARFLFSGNIEYLPSEKIMVKLYCDHQTIKADSSSVRSAVSVFAGFRNKKVMAGAEYNLLQNVDFTDNENNDYSGISLYSGYKINWKTEVFGRFDLFSLVTGLDNVNYYIFGFQYTPAPAYNISINFRNYTPANMPQLFANFGIKF
ncbi:MAG: hypothetical protein A2W91_14170 [Bacteroidetes bacterium GWF2_38_335]|nr:MAG: hypothetical protein A2W91_14170 [Bacteroidetes bacterium GWF2_38_335]OFY79391.1 MAG: hypothetical protein A2281_16985 [Bacteroidetes bacterium RIFOXYA12_FULL_38_20]HBS85655.1 hypothetical protein [Bacteroidales bacterium]